MAGKHLIGFTGKKFSGKDTSAAAVKSLLEAGGYNVITTAFADPIRDEVTKILGCTKWSDAMHPQHPDGFDDRIFDWESFKSKDNLGNDIYNISGRDFFRGIGMLMRAYDENQFTEYVARKYEEAPANTVVLITDVRFDNEAALIETYGGHIVEVTSDKQQRAIQRGFMAQDMHVTEQGISPLFSRVSLHNPNSLPQPQSWFKLAANAAKLLKELKLLP